MCVRVRHHHSPQLRKSNGKHGWVGVCVCVCVSGIILPLTATCVCMCMYGNITECLQLHKAVILQLIIKYFVLKIAYYHATFTAAHLQFNENICIQYKLHLITLICNYIVWLINKLQSKIYLYFLVRVFCCEIKCEREYFV